MAEQPGREPSPSRPGRAGARETCTQPRSPLSLQVPLISQTQLKAREPVTQSVGPQSSDQGQEEWAVGLR